MWLGGYYSPGDATFKAPLALEHRRRSHPAGIIILSGYVIRVARALSREETSRVNYEGYAIVRNALRRAFA